jgi:broad specificity phosphatase PhoE
MVPLRMRILLVRHGHPDVTTDERRPIAGTELGRWYRRYNEVGLAPVSSPPDGLRAAAATAGCLVASDLRRAIESARLLARSKPVQLDSDLREVGFPEGLNASTRLSPGVWVMIARAAWLLDRCDCEEPKSAARQRAARLVDHLSNLAYEHGSVIAVGHGWFNLFVGRELRRRHWNGPHLMPSGYWSSAQFERSSRDPQPG